MIRSLEVRELEKQRPKEGKGLIDDLTDVAGKAAINTCYSARFATYQLGVLGGWTPSPAGLSHAYLPVRSWLLEGVHMGWM